MDRRSLMKRAGIAGVLASGIAPAVHAQPAVRWRLSSSFPKSLDTIWGSAETLSKTVKDLSGGKFEISIHAGGELMPARKGVARFVIKAEGVASHAGTTFEKGHSAISEMARQIAYLDSLVDIENGITLNVGLINGGTAPNTVAQFCTIEVDVRVKTLDQAGPIVRAIHGIKPHDPNVRLTVEGELNRPPFFPDAGSKALFEHARKLAAPIGIDPQPRNR